MEDEDSIRPDAAMDGLSISTHWRQLGKDLRKNQKTKIRNKDYFHEIVWNYY